MRIAVALSLVAALAGCKSPSKPNNPMVFTCVNDSQCVLNGQQGICVPADSVCALPDASCESGYRYDTSAGGPAGICVPPHSTTNSGALGAMCAKNEDCQSANCVDGVCCDSDCTGACRSCSLAGNVGHCTNIAAGAMDVRGACVGDGSACGLDGTCDGATHCAYAPSTKICGAAQSCVNGTVTTAPHCNGMGTCGTTASRACDPYVCKADGSDCESTCTAGGSQCKPPNTCTNGSCGKSGLGASCSLGSDCLSGNCVDGVCCSTASCNACNACNLNGAGTCSPIGSGQTDSRCGTATPQASCGVTGTCNGAGACAYWPAGTVCGSPHCSSNIAYTNTVTCPGGGAACPTQITTNCGAYLCYLNGSTPTCYTDCGNTCGPLQSPYCVPGHQCKNCTMIGFGMCV